MRIVWISLAYTNPNVLIRSYWDYIASVDDRFDGVSCHVVVDNHYPLHREEMQLRLAQIPHMMPNAFVIDPGKNLGLHGGFNYALKWLVENQYLDAAIKEPDGSYDDYCIIFYDPDESPRTPGWIQTMRKVMVREPGFGWLSLTSPLFDNDNVAKDCPVMSVGGVRVLVPEKAHVNQVCMARWSALKKIGGELKEQWAYYGGIEATMWPMFKRAGYRVGYLADFRTESEVYAPLQDHEYEVYKWRHARDVDAFTGSFEDWLIERNLPAKV